MRFIKLLNLVKDLATLHGLDEEGITNEFVAFTHTSKVNHHSRLTEVLLLQFEREVKIILFHWLT